mmetsp:Transcript_145236/g.263872  ORF Transcript_145236/g.263872 Transcript_145236/m.263872 type:complete len:259 (-) Transcript_145236:617-1393(-)
MQIVQPSTYPTCSHDDIALQDLTTARVYLRNAHAEGLISVNRPRDCVEARVTCIIVLWPIFIAWQNTADGVCRKSSHLEGIVPSFDALLEGLVPPFRHRRVNVDTNLLVWQSIQIILPDNRHTWVNGFSGVDEAAAKLCCVHAQVCVILCEVRQSIIKDSRGHRLFWRADHRESNTHLSSLSKKSQGYVKVRGIRPDSCQVVRLNLRTHHWGYKESSLNKLNSINDYPAFVSIGCHLFKFANPWTIHTFFPGPLRLRI